MDLHSVLLYVNYGALEGKIVPHPILRATTALTPKARVNTLLNTSAIE